MQAGGKIGPQVSTLTPASVLPKQAANIDWTAQELYRQIKQSITDNRRRTPDGRGVDGRNRKGEPGSLEYIQSLVDLAGRLTRGLANLDENTKRSSRSTRALEPCLTSLEEAVRHIKKRLVD